MNFKMRNKTTIVLMSLLLIIVLVGCSNNNTSTSGKAGDQQSAGEPVKGGTLKVAIPADPDTLDWMYTGASSTRDVGWHIFETLIALDKNYAPKPMIAEKYEVSEDKKLYTFKLRKNVKFHDGSTVTADDVVASIERWRKISSVGKIASSSIEQVNAVDENTVQVKLNKVYNALIPDFSAPKNALAILPAKITKESVNQPLKPEQLIGTGPYKFDKWDRGKEIVLSRFDNYSSREETDWGGLTGKKVAYFDQIKFQIVQDSQVMLNGLKTDLYDYAQGIPADLYEVVKSTKKIEPVTYINGYSTIIPDKSEPPFDDLKVRQALNYALDKKAIAATAYGNEKFYSFDGALFDPEQKELYSKDGTDQYLVYDPEKAKKLLAESSYDGRTLKLVFANTTDKYSRISQVVKQQMEAVGFKVELVNYEWATYLEKWGKPANWDLVAIGWSTRFSPNELGMLTLNASSSGWYKSDRWQKLLVDWGKAEKTEQKKEVLTEMNRTVYEELPFIKIANETTLDIKNSKIQKYEGWISQRFWNTWKSK